MREAVPVDQVGLAVVAHARAAIGVGRGAHDAGREAGRPLVVGPRLDRGRAGQRMPTPPIGLPCRARAELVALGKAGIKDMG